MKSPYTGIKCALVSGDQGSGAAVYPMLTQPHQCARLSCPSQTSAVRTVALGGEEASHLRTKGEEQHDGTLPALLHAQLTSFSSSFWKTHNATLFLEHSLSSPYWLSRFVPFVSLLGSNGAGTYTEQKTSSAKPLTSAAVKRRTQPTITGLSDLWLLQDPFGNKVQRGHPICS